MIIHDYEQGSDEWKAVRLGKFTASDFHILMGDSQTKSTILLKKAAERITGRLSDGDSFSSLHTDRGKELEAEAREYYSTLSMNEVSEVGFVEFSPTIGCSPDGLIGNEGGVEIKCKDNHNHLFAVMNNYMEPAHRTQCQFNMFVTGRQWWDYVLYNKNFTNHCFVITVVRDNDYINKIIACLAECEAKILNHIRKFNEACE